MNKKIISILILSFVIICSFYQPIPIKATEYWWNINWVYKTKITINSSKINEDLYNFTILVFLDGTNVNWGHIQDDLDDIRFVNSNEITLLKAELEDYTLNTEAWIWVKIPFIDNNIDTYFYLYYGNNVVSSYWDKENTWSSDIKMVQHMVDYPDSSHITDSTINNNDGTKTGSNQPFETNQWLDGTQNFDGLNDMIHIDFDTISTYPLTISFFIDLNMNTGYYQHPISIDGQLITYFIDPNSRNQLYFKLGGTINQSVYIIDLTEDVFYHVVMSFDGMDYSFYVDGINITNWSQSQQTLTDCIMRIGYDGSNFFNGVLDEIRIYNSTKYLYWIQADYYSCILDLLSFENELTLSILTIRYNIGIDKLYVNNIELSNNTSIYFYQGSNVNITAISKTNFIFDRHILGLTNVSMTPTFIFNMINSFIIWSYATPNFYIEQPSTFNYLIIINILVILLGLLAYKIPISALFGVALSLVIAIPQALTLADSNIIGFSVVACLITTICFIFKWKLSSF